MEKTLTNYDTVLKKCFKLFLKKFIDYGASWRVMRLPSLTDQIFIKAKRIRNIQQGKQQKVDDSISTEFIGIINYSIISLIQLELPPSFDVNLKQEVVEELFQKNAEKARTLMQLKNHDYGEAWRDLRESSIIDLIIQKLYRIKQIENNQGKLIASEGLEANYLDMINYAAFALMLNNT